MSIINIPSTIMHALWFNCLVWKRKIPKGSYYIIVENKVFWFFPQMSIFPSLVLTSAVLVQFLFLTYMDQFQNFLIAFSVSNSYPPSAPHERELPGCLLNVVLIALLLLGSALPSKYKLNSLGPLKVLRHLSLSPLPPRHPPLFSMPWLRHGPWFIVPKTPTCSLSPSSFSWNIKYLYPQYNHPSRQSSNMTTFTKTFSICSLGYWNVPNSNTFLHFLKMQCVYTRW